ncbi:hypothetical protein L202_03841 [Cryptococcus amylolentus CBS 6039]|uniref:Uncharacterized protein n=1 Tax=Cryptococcus amylolentus CBS 6039 TaxID=1295533 RepID=A0A1E3HUF7_9TREE|nr:hypothetical protein L202_03841 [Cryptococcus amylolentus CBS 6039]ODN79968.1 hypothetical protein L202_03841 [Cryptococcus amylolentus CBS 6039]
MAEPEFHSAPPLKKRKIGTCSKPSISPADIERFHKSRKDKREKARGKENTSGRPSDPSARGSSLFQITSKQHHRLRLIPCPTCLLPGYTHMLLGGYLEQRRILSRRGQKGARMCSPSP